MNGYKVIGNSDSCGHNHPTLLEACNCRRNLQKVVNGQTSAEFYNAGIVRFDNSKVTSEEYAEMEKEMANIDPYELGLL